MRQCQQESGYNLKAKSTAGALGLFQLMPATAMSLGVDPEDPLQNIKGGLMYLSQQYERFGSLKLALAAYNAGPNAAEKALTQYAETIHYVEVICRDGLCG